MLTVGRPTVRRLRADHGASFPVPAGGWVGAAAPPPSLPAERPPKQKQRGSGRCIVFGLLFLGKRLQELRNARWLERQVTLNLKIELAANASKLREPKVSPFRH